MGCTPRGAMYQNPETGVRGPLTGDELLALSPNARASYVHQIEQLVASKQAEAQSSDKAAQALHAAQMLAAAIPGGQLAAGAFALISELGFALASAFGGTDVDCWVEWIADTYRTGQHEAVHQRLLEARLAESTATAEQQRLVYMNEFQKVAMTGAAKYWTDMANKKNAELATAMEKVHAATLLYNARTGAYRQCQTDLNSLQAQIDQKRPVLQAELSKVGQAAAGDYLEKAAAYKAELEDTTAEMHQVQSHMDDVHRMLSLSELSVLVTPRALVKVGKFTEA